jgi:hypothetical protein
VKKKEAEAAGKQFAGGFQNCILEIDTSDYPDASTLLLSKNLSKFSDREQECLLSCYNIYKWVGYEIIKFHGKHVPLVRLKILPVDGIYDAETSSLTTPYYQVGEKWLTARPEELLSREVDPELLHENFMDLRMTFLMYVKRHNARKGLPEAQRYNISPALKPFLNSGENFEDGQHPYAEALEEYPEQDQETCALHLFEFEDMVNSR